MMSGRTLDRECSTRPASHIVPLVVLLAVAGVEVTRGRTESTCLRLCVFWSRMGVVPLSAHNQLHPLTDAAGEWTGVLAPNAVAAVPVRTTAINGSWFCRVSFEMSAIFSLRFFRFSIRLPSTCGCCARQRLLCEAWLCCCCVEQLEKAVSMEGLAGTITVHNARCVHGSKPNGSVRWFASIAPSEFSWSARRATNLTLCLPACLQGTSRPLLLNTFSPASAHMLPVGTNPLHLASHRGNPVVRGSDRSAVRDPRAEPAAAPPWAPNFAGGYTPPFFKKTAGEEAG